MIQRREKLAPSVELDNMNLGPKLRTCGRHAVTLVAAASTLFPGAVLARTTRANTAEARPPLRVSYNQATQGNDTIGEGLDNFGCLIVAMADPHQGGGRQTQTFKNGRIRWWTPKALVKQGLDPGSVWTFQTTSKTS